jgi:hypothetical protein
MVETLRFWPNMEAFFATWKHFFQICILEFKMKFVLAGFDFSF